MIVEAIGITRSYANRSGALTEVLHGIDLKISTGEMVAIVGPSGSGKSTLLNCLAGLERPTSGTVHIGGTNTGAANATTLAKMRRGTVAFVFQQYNLIDSLSVYDNVAIPARLARRPKPCVTESLRAVGVAGLARRTPALLSGGEQQRVAIARALAVRPKVLFADEPTGALDSTSAKGVLRLLRQQATSSETAVVLVTHDLEAAASADRVLVLKDGRIHADLSAVTAVDLLRVFEDIADSTDQYENKAS